MKTEKSYFITLHNSLKSYEITLLHVFPIRFCVGTKSSGKKAKITLKSSAAAWNRVQNVPRSSTAQITLNIYEITLQRVMKSYEITLFRFHAI